MASKTSKLSDIITETSVLSWLAETLQEKVAKENAGFIQIEAKGRRHEPKLDIPPQVVLTTPSKRKITLSINLAQVR